MDRIAALKELIRRPWGVVFLALAASSCAAVGLVGIRCVKSWTPTYLNLVWNLVLAWMPVVFAVLACRPGITRRRVWVFSAMWLLFLPNAPYLVTDLVHLRDRPPVPLWYDLILIQLFICTGLFLGFLSLHWMHRLWSERVGWRSGWVFVGVVAFLTGFGIYLGRFERLNSWDVFLQPFELARNIWVTLTVPEAYRTAGRFSAIFGTFFLLAYLTLFGLVVQRWPACGQCEQGSV